VRLVGEISGLDINALRRILESGALDKETIKNKTVYKY
jgi:hypothetical protein